MFQQPTPLFAASRLLLALLMVCALGSGNLAQDEGDARPQPENYDQWRKALDAEATPAEELEPLIDFEVQLLRSARPGEGSWVSMAFDPQGRLTISREDQGLLQLLIPDIPINPRHIPPHPPEPTDDLELPPDAADDKVANDEQSDDAQSEPHAEPENDNDLPSPDLSQQEADSGQTPWDPFLLRTVEDTLKECRGLLYAYDALYANANNSKGLYRLQDRDDDGHFEDVQLLRATPGGVGHGRNDLALGPDGLIYSIHGNDVKLPEDYQLGHSPYRNYAVDQLLPCEWNKYLFNAGATVPAGHVVRTDPEGKLWEMVAGGFRNPYGLAFNADGELFTYDADMEWDAGAPWYRPTRVHHIVSGADYGWRQGTSKLPAFSPDTWPANLDIGLGSPTAVVFGTKSNFPARYQRALYILDWAYGRILAIHLSPRGASYGGELEVFLKGTPLNITDVTFGPDGHMYFITGGRKTQSGLYRVKYVGAVETAAEVDPRQAAVIPPAPQDARSAPVSAPSPLESELSASQLAEIVRAERRLLESFHGRVNKEAVGVAWDYLGSKDPWLRSAARVAIEHQPADTWQERALAERDPSAALQSLMALARVGDRSIQPQLLARLAHFSLAELDAEQTLVALRTYQLAFIRMGSPDEATSARVRELLSAHYPGDDYRADRMLCELLVYLDDPTVLAKTLPLLEGERTEKEKLHYLFTLRHVKRGWSLAQRKVYFHWLRKARGFPGAHYIPRFAHYIEQDALAHLTAKEKAQIAPILEMKLSEPVVDLSAGRKFVKDWKLIDFVFSLEDVGQGRNFDRGKTMFAAAACNRCHRIGGEGSPIGPDLSDVSKRFNRRDLLVSILAPSKVIADKYRNTRFVTKGGKILTGTIVSEDDNNVRVMTDPLKPDEITQLSKSDVESQEPSPVSSMPEDLLDTLKLAEILDLLAYIEAAGDANHKNFKP